MNCLHIRDCADPTAWLQTYIRNRFCWEQLKEEREREESERKKRNVRRVRIAGELMTPFTYCKSNNEKQSQKQRLRKLKESSALAVIVDLWENAAAEHFSEHPKRNIDASPEIKHVSRVEALERRIDNPEHIQYKSQYRTPFS